MFLVSWFFFIDFFGNFVSLLNIGCLVVGLIGTLSVCWVPDYFVDWLVSRLVTWLFCGCLVVRVFANGLGDLGSIPGRVIPKTQKMVLDASLLNTQHYKVRIKGKVKQSREGVAPSPTPWCSSYRKGSLRVTLDYGRQLVYLCKYKKHDLINKF